MWHHGPWVSGAPMGLSGFTGACEGMPLWLARLEGSMAGAQHIQPTNRKLLKQRQGVHGSSASSYGLPSVHAH